MVVNIYKIDYSKIKENLLSLNKSDYLVVKSNAYGFGFENVCLIAYLCGMKKFCVLDILDAIYLKEKYNDSVVLLLGPIDYKCLEKYEKYQIHITITKNLDFEIIKDYNILYQIEVNSGMNRFGLLDLPYEIINNDIRFKGVYSHNATNNIDFINNQLQYFFERVKCFNDIEIHFSSSSSMDLKIPFTNSRRIGCEIYKDSLEIKAKIIHINYCLKDSYIGYDYSYKLESNNYIGVIDIGYADGLERNCNGFLVYNGENYFPLIGKACMNHSFILLEDDSLLNKEVTIIGKDNNINNYVNYFKKIPHEVYLAFLKCY